MKQNEMTKQYCIEEHEALAAYVELINDIKDAQDALTSSLSLFEEVRNGRNYWELTDAQRSLFSGIEQFVRSAHDALHCNPE